MKFLLRLKFLFALISARFVLCQKEFKSAPTTVKAPENDTVLLPCYLETITNEGSAFNRIKWFKNKELLADTGPDSVSLPERFTVWPNGSLQVVNIQPEDTAEYTCEIFRPEPWSSIKQKHAIEVLHQPSVTADPLTGFLEVKLREEVRMSCKPEGVPYPMIIWRYQGKEIQLLDNREMLKFVASDRHLAGEYECIARNGVGEPASATITLHIIYPPELMTVKSWMHTAPGIRAQLECHVSADPSPNVKWYKGETPVVYSNRVVPMVDGNKYILLIRNATVSDFGIYTCRASNDLGHGELQVQLSGTANPGVFKESDQKSVDSKTSYKLIWEVDSYSPIIEYNLWFRRYRPGNDVRNADWTTLTIPAEHTTGPVHSKAYTIQGLKEKTIYEVLLTSRNRYGWSKPSSIMKFATEGADFKDQVITPVQIQFYEEFETPKVVMVSGSSTLCDVQKLFFICCCFLISIKMFS